MSALLKQMRQDSPHRLWPLTDASGTASDASGNAGNGTYVGSPSLASRSLLLGRVADFDGSNDYVNCGSYNLSGSASQTLEIWGMTDIQATAGGSEPHGLQTAFGVEYSANLFELRIGTLTPEFVVKAGTTTHVLTGTAVAIGELFHLVGVYTSTTLRFYQNGVLVDSEASGGSLVANQTFAIGHVTPGQGYTRPFNGALGYAAMYTATELVADRVKAHYQAGIRSGVVSG